jgi:PAS domain S-box-containing protein
MSAKKPLRALIIEDSEFDARVLVNTLRQGGYDVAFARVDTARAMEEALAAGTGAAHEPWQVVLADYNLPDFSAPAALETLRRSGQDIPFLIVSGGIGEDTAIAAMKAGAHDYLMKGSLARLAPAVERELADAEVRRSRRAAVDALRDSELRYRTLWETSPDAVVFCREDGTILFGNPAVQAVLGYTDEELSGRNLAELEAAASQGALSQALRQLAGDAAALRTPRELAGRARDGRETVLEFTASRMDLGGQPSFVLFIRDITERRRAEAELRHNEEQFRVARDIQQQLYPREAPRVPGFDLAAATTPAEATGGDYFDFFPLADGSLGLVVADVSGHGLGPALLMAETRAYLRILAKARHDPGDILTRANRVLADDLDGERYVTLLLVRLEPATRRFTYASGGHPPAYVFDAAGRRRLELKRNGPALGLDAGRAYAASTEQELRPGETLVLLTDGVLEATSRAGLAFGIAGVEAVLAGRPAATAAELVDAVRAAVLAHGAGGPGADDVTLVVVRAAPAGAAA